MPDLIATPTRPWWRHGMLWMVISGPATVVVAGFVTMFLAFSGQDPVLSESVGGSPRAPGASTRPVPVDAALAPAMQGRNHAATGVVPPPR